MEFVTPFKEVPFSLTVFAAFLFCFGIFLPFNFVILSAEYNGMSANLAGYLIAVCASRLLLKLEFSQFAKQSSGLLFPD